jgi:hypothetical protein
VGLVAAAAGAAGAAGLGAPVPDDLTNDVSAREETDRDRQREKGEDEPIEHRAISIELLLQRRDLPTDPLHHHLPRITRSLSQGHTSSRS